MTSQKLKLKGVDHMKKLISITIITLLLSTILSIIFISQAYATTTSTQEEQVTTITSVYHDNQFKAYYVILTNNQNEKESFAYELFKSYQENNYHTQLLKEILLNKKAIIYFNNMGTDCIYDDELISFKLLQ